MSTQQKNGGVRYSAHVVVGDPHVQAILLPSGIVELPYSYRVAHVEVLPDGSRRVRVPQFAEQVTVENLADIRACGQQCGLDGIDNIVYTSAKSPSLFARIRSVFSRVEQSPSPQK